VDNKYDMSNGYSEAKVIVRKLGHYQLGIYTCRAKNKLGTSEKEFLVTEAPNCKDGQCIDFYQSSSQIVNSYYVFPFAAWITILLN